MRMIAIPFTRVPALIILVLSSLPFGLSAQTEAAELRALVEEYRNNDRGPYRGIFWFCADGELVEARDTCPDRYGARQHADYRPRVKQLMRNDGIYLGQILTNTSRTTFWDAENDHSRLKQYQLGQYLADVDNGWVLERARYYRGAFQIEDEERWGLDFFRWVLRKDEVMRQHFYLLSRAARDIPHRGDTDLNQRIRTLSKQIADRYEAFMDLRIKIHGRPEGSDAEAVAAFLEQHRDELGTLELVTPTEQLIEDIRTAYGGSDLAKIASLTGDLRASDSLKNRIETFLAQHPRSEDQDNTIDRLSAAAELSLHLRRELVAETDRPAGDRLLLIDINNELGDLIFRGATDWKPGTAREQMEKICYLGQAATGAGLVELWEYDVAGTGIADPNYQYIWPPMFADYLDQARRFVEWGTATNRATYGDIVERYVAFEPKAAGFLDDQVRSTVLLPLGQAVGDLGDWYASNTESGNALMDLRNPGRARGLNPGYARGKLHLIEGSPEEVEVNNRDIFIFNRAPSDLRPVGGIMTVSEGNAVSHVQLLARNLGIPNAVITDAQFADLQDYEGEEVFYAVSNAGTVLLKPASSMTDIERELFAERERSEERVRIPTDRIDLATQRVLDMRDVSSEDSGVRCGPKAANLGQLKDLFPENVVEGLVIPFGIFRAHLDQPMPGQPAAVTYWSYLNDIFSESAKMERVAAGEGPRSESQAAGETVEAYTLRRLDTLREAINRMPLRPELIQQLRTGFREVFGDRMGRVPVFLRSDTNMEDLADFTGAGLNKTVFNVVDEQKILEGIREVWASPYRERPYKWRQRYMLNPENVFPSILIIPSVDVDYSGVLITKGVSSGNDADFTVAFSRGAGGAVDGQAAEAYLLDSYGRATLQAPARERLHRRLPVSGGSIMVPAAFDERILREENLQDLYELGRRVEKVMPGSPGVTSEGPFDVELGFQNGKIWLFQIRPFVENDLAQRSEYLQSISPAEREGVYIDLSSEISTVGG